MVRAHITREADCNSLAGRFSGALLLAGIVFLLTACGGGGGGETSGSSTPSGSSGPTTPVLASAAVLTWDPVVAPSVSGYRVYYGTTPGKYLQSKGQGVNVGNATTYTITGLSSGTRYYFVTTAYDASGNESPYSTEVFKDIP